MRRKGRWSHPVLTTPGSRLIDLRVELPQGSASMFRLNEIMDSFKDETVRLVERTHSLPDKRGVWGLSSYETLIWVSGDQLRPFQEALSSLTRDGFRVQLADIMTTPEAKEDDPGEDPRRRWVNS